MIFGDWRETVNCICIIIWKYIYMKYKRYWIGRYNLFQQCTFVRKQKGASYPLDVLIVKLILQLGSYDGVTQTDLKKITMQTHKYGVIVEYGGTTSCWLIFPSWQNKNHATHERRCNVYRTIRCRQKRAQIATILTISYLACDRAFEARVKIYMLPAATDKTSRWSW